MLIDQHKFLEECTILKSRIKMKLNDDVLSTFQQGLDEIVLNNCILSGGAISSIYWGLQPKDYDLYAIDTTSLLAITVAGEKSDQSSVVSTHDSEYAKYITVIFDRFGKLYTKNAITFKNTAQFIKIAPFDQMQPNFDFVHCMPHYNLKTDQFYISEQQYYSIKEKKLIKNPGHTNDHYRTQKYLDKGWSL